MSRVLVRDERLLLTLVNGEVIDTLSDDPFSVLFEVTYLDENDNWRFRELKPEIGAPETEVYSPTETIEIVQLHPPVSGTDHWRSRCHTGGRRATGNASEGTCIREREVL